MKPYTITLFLLLLAGKIVAQDSERIPRSFSREDRIEILLRESKKQKRLGFVALVAGPIITAAGISIVAKENKKTGFGGDVPNENMQKAGSIITGAGVLITIASVPSFIQSGKSKKQAALLMKKETSLLPVGQRDYLALGLSLHL